MRRLARLHGRAVRYVVSSHVDDRADVDEIVADVLRLAYDNLHKLRSATEDQRRSWLLRTGRYLAANHVRRTISRHRLHGRLSSEPWFWAPSGEESYIADDETTSSLLRSQVVRDVLDGLRDDYRQVLVMDALGDHGTNIGAHLGVSANAARKRLMRARRAFRDAYLAAVDCAVSDGRPPT